MLKSFDLVRWREAYTPETWKPCLEYGLAEGNMLRDLREATLKCRPIGSDRFLDLLENQYGIQARPRKPGPHPKKANSAGSTASAETTVAVA